MLSNDIFVEYLFSGCGLRDDKLRWIYGV